MKTIRVFLLLFASGIPLISAQHQGSGSYTVTGKTWSICEHMEYRAHEQGTDALETVALHSDGTYEAKIRDGKTDKKANGTWKYEDGLLTLRQNGNPMGKLLTGDYAISWMDEHRFYSSKPVGMANGKPRYIYFVQRND